MKQLLAIAVCCAVAFSAASAVALDPGAASLDTLSVDQKQQLVDVLERANAAYDAGRFDEAREAYERAYSIYAKPSYIYGIALSYEKGGHDREALEHYRLYLKVAPKDLPNRGKIEATIERLEQRVAEAERATLRVTTDPPDAEVIVGEEPAGRTPVELRLQPGTHRIAVQKEGYEPRYELVEVSPGSEREVSWELQEIEVAQEPPAPDDPIVEQRDFPTGLFVTTAALAIVSAGTGVAWLIADADADSRAERIGDNTRDSAQRARTVANGLTVGFWTATALTAGFGVITLVKLSSSPETDVEIAILPGGAELRVRIP